MHDLLHSYAHIHGAAAFQGLATEPADEDTE